MTQPIAKSFVVIAAWAAMALSLAVPGPSPAQEGRRYVTDQLEITLRSGPGTNYAIRQMLKSGAPVQVIEDDGQGYTRAQTADGTTGWVLSRFLSDEPAARERLEESERRMEEMRLQTELIREELLGMIQLRDDLARAQAENEELQSELRRVNALTEDTQSIVDRNRDLEREIGTSRAERQALIDENSRLADESNQNWFLIGAGVLILGMLIGLTIPNVRWKKRRSSTGGIDMDF